MGLRRHRPKRAPAIPGAVFRLRLFCAGRPKMQDAYAMANHACRNAERLGAEILESDYGERLRRGQLGVLLQARLFWPVELGEPEPLAKLKEFLVATKELPGVFVIEAQFEEKTSECWVT